MKSTNLTINYNSLNYFWTQNTCNFYIMHAWLNFCTNHLIYFHLKITIILVSLIFTAPSSYASTHIKKCRKWFVIFTYVCFAIPLTQKIIKQLHKLEFHRINIMIWSRKRDANFCWNEILVYFKGKTTQYNNFYFTKLFIW